LGLPLAANLRGAGYILDTAGDGEQGEFLGAAEHYVPLS
jgi:hypothetical protein